MKNAYFAGGCFWCITPVFQCMDGVHRVVSGYSGGAEADPTYEQVKHQLTGHRESILIEYEPELIGFERLMDVFLENVDPFDGEGQFIDRGASYTLAVYYTDETERAIAQAKVDALAAAEGRQVFVSIEPFRGFYRAEEYHQDYAIKNPEAFEQELISSGRKKR